jgi:hypothetical protein
LWNEIHYASDRFQLKRPIINRFFPAASLLLLALFYTGPTHAAKKAPNSLTPCLLRVRIHIDQGIDSTLIVHFSKSLYGALEQKFMNINLCVDTCTRCPAVTPGGVDLRIGYEEDEEGIVYCGSIVVYFEKTEDSTVSEDRTNQVLTLFQVPAGIDRGGLYMVVAEKIVENVRREVLGEVKISLQPEGTHFILDSSLGENQSPKTLLLPPGSYTLHAWLPKYLPYQQEVTISVPGVTDIKATLKRRHFYHSRYLPIVALLGISAGGAFYAEYYYYNRYKHLGEDDLKNRPEEFEKLYKIAKDYEFAAFTLSGLTVAGVTLTFFF